MLFFAVSLSSNIISTDPFLLLFWSFSLYFFKNSLDNKSIKHVLFTSFFVAAGFYSKYAMIYFFLCSFFLTIISENKKLVIKNTLIVLAFVFILISPHVYWSYSSNWVTFIHTGSNLNWNSSLFNFEQLFNFIASQFFIATPIIFTLYLIGFIKFIISKILTKKVGLK